MKVIDLTHFIAEDMPVYPGTEGPVLAPLTPMKKMALKKPG